MSCKIFRTYIPIFSLTITELFHIINVFFHIVLIYNAKIILPYDILYGYLLIENGKIVGIESGCPDEQLAAYPS